MDFLSHRGVWKTAKDKNTESAFRRALDCGFGIETDVRDQCRELVISHDPPVGDSLSFEALLAMRRGANSESPLAINVKSDGLQASFTKALRNESLKGLFFFDMSIPDMLEYDRAGLPFFTRVSEYEHFPALYDRAVGVWIDCFVRDWPTKDDIWRHVLAGKRVCLVSPELHKRDHQPYWRTLKSWDLHRIPDALLCTDFPEEARKWFYPDD